MGKVVKLICITENNNNKFYQMTDNENGTFTVEYGRVGAKAQVETYPSSKWDSKYREKIKKGYKDNTELFVVEKSSAKKIVKDFISSRTTQVINIVNKLQGWAKGSVERNYEVSSNDVTQAQVDKAQSVINELVSFDLNTNNISEFNKLLISFFGIVPRKMKNVKSHLISTELTDINELTEIKNKIISEEQATLDVMAGQVKLQSDVEDDEEEHPEVEHDIISSSGLEIKHVTDSAIIKQIKDLMGSDSNMFKEAYEVVNISTQKNYDNNLNKAKDKKEELFWHGSRNENWWSILTTGLKIRPSNAVYTGSMFGNAIYFASKYRKSYGYTSGRNSYWVKGNSNEAVLALYSVHVGNQKHIYKHDSSCYNLNYDRIQKDGYDSVYAHGGADLRNDEFMIYTEAQCTVKYLVVVNS